MIPDLLAIVNEAVIGMDVKTWWDVNIVRISSNKTFKVVAISNARRIGTEEDFKEITSKLLVNGRNFDYPESNIDLAHPDSLKMLRKAIQNHIE